MKKFPDDKEMPFYRLIRDRLRIFKPLPYHAGLMPCPVTPGLKPSFIPDSPILKSGNLLRKPGLARRALGQYVEVTGRVLDERCVPIENAVIEIWQADHTGKNENDYVVSGVWDVKDPDYDKYFAYSGTAQTNNVGEFSFLTIFPGTSQEQKTQAPHINVRVIHPKFEPVTTRLYFAKHPRNDADEELLSLSANKKTGQDDLRNRVIMDGKSLDPTYKYEGRRYQQTITLQGIDPYRGY